MSVNRTLKIHREPSFSVGDRDKDDCFELQMQRFLLTDTTYSNKFKNVWMWNEFFANNYKGLQGAGIALLAQNIEDHFWAIQCKGCKQGALVDKKATYSLNYYFVTSTQKQEVASHTFWLQFID